MFKPLNGFSVVFFVVEFSAGIVVHAKHIIKKASAHDSGSDVENFRAIVDSIV